MPTQPSRHVEPSHPDTRTAPTWGLAPPSSRANAEASTDRVGTFLAQRMRTVHATRARAVTLAPPRANKRVSRLRGQVSPMRAGGGIESTLEMGEGIREGTESGRSREHPEGGGRGLRGWDGRGGFQRHQERRRGASGRGRGRRGRQSPGRRCGVGFREGTGERGRAPPGGDGTQCGGIT